MKYLCELYEKPKCDLHCHAARGGDIKIISKEAGKEITIKDSFSSVTEMDSWFWLNVNSIFSGKLGYELLVENTILRALNENIKYLYLGFDVERLKLYNTVEEYIHRIDILIKKYPQMCIIPEITITKALNYRESIIVAKEILGCNYFKSIDLVGEELLIDFREFICIYRIAKNKGMRLRAHVGEYGDAALIRCVTDMLELDEVQHGITAAYSKDVMKYLLNNSIQINICPTSNICMGIVDNYVEHPIKLLFDFGLNITINTDDCLVFNSNLTQEYFRLYKSGVFTPDELETIRVRSMECCSNLWG